jgi:hypothetical protein
MRNPSDRAQNMQSSCVPLRVANSVLVRLRAVVVRVPGYRSRGPGSIPCATTFSEKQWVCNGVHSASLLELGSYLEKIAASV